jgi:hypothetical protein
MPLWFVHQSCPSFQPTFTYNVTVIYFKCLSLQICQCQIIYFSLSFSFLPFVTGKTLQAGKWLHHVTFFIWCRKSLLMDWQHWVSSVSDCKAHYVFHVALHVLSKIGMQIVFFYFYHRVIISVVFEPSQLAERHVYVLKSNTVCCNINFANRIESATSLTVLYIVN